MATIKTQKIYKDIDLSFRANPFTKDIYTKTDEDAIKTALKHLIQTRNFERPFHPEIGTQLYSLLFENNTAAVIIAMERSIRDAIENYEPRVRIVNLQIKDQPDSNDVLVILTFAIKNIGIPITITTLIRRVR